MGAEGMEKLNEEAMGQVAGGVELFKKVTSRTPLGDCPKCGGKNTRFRVVVKEYNYDAPDIREDYEECDVCGRLTPESDPRVP